jgi:hypothetical protein
MKLSIKLGLIGALGGLLVAVAESLSPTGSPEVRFAIWPGQLIFMDGDPNAPGWNAFSWAFAFASNMLLFGIPTFIVSAFFIFVKRRVVGEM